jgi:DNA-binding transcriptional ArsR family regulator
METSGLSGCAHLNSSSRSNIDNRRFNHYSYTMNAPSSPLDNALHAIADPTRRRILQALKQRDKSSGPSSGEKNGLCAGDIEACVRLTQPTISHHMSILTKAGLVEATRQGQRRWYKRNERALRRFVKSLRAQL